MRFDSVIETIHKIDADKSQMKLIILLIVCHRANELNSDGELEYYFSFRFDVNTWKKKEWCIYVNERKKKNCTLTLNVLIIVHVEKFNVCSLDCNSNA